MTGPAGAWPPPPGDPRGAGDETTCEHFRDLAEDLALGAVDDPERARLYRHAAACPACQARLDELALLADRLLLAAPELEPPTGFEGRVLEHLAAAAAAPAAVAAHPSGRPVPHRPGRRRRSLLAVVAAVALVVALLGGGFLLGREANGGESDAAPASTTAPAGPAATSSSLPGASGDALPATRSGPIVRADGSRSGTAMLVAQPRPLVLVTIDSPRPSGNRVSCQLVLADGTSATVGTWGYDDVAAGAWATGIPTEFLDAVQMNVLDGSGSVVASANLR